MNKSIRGIVFILMVLFSMALFSQQTLKKLGQWGSASFTDIVVNGRYAYCAAGYAGLEIIDINDRTHPVRVAGIETSSPAEKLCCNNGFVYIAAGNGNLLIIDIHDPLHPVERASANVGKYFIAISVKGFYVYLTANRNETLGLATVDVSNPSHPFPASFLSRDFPGEFSGNMCIRGNYLYATTRRGFAIINISNPATPFLVSSREIIPNRNDFHYNPIQLKDDHALILGNYIEDENHGYCPPVFAIYNIADPTNPYKTWESRDFDEYDSLCISGDLLYAKRWKYLDLIDISNVSQPVLVKSVDIEKEYLSSIYCEGKNIFSLVSGGGFVVFSLDYPWKPSKVASYDECGFAHSVWAFDNKICCAHGNGLQLVDASNPLSPKLESSYFEPNRIQYPVEWGMVQGNFGHAICSRARNYFDWKTIDLSNPLHPFSVWTYPLQYWDNSVRRLVVRDRFGYVTVSSSTTDLGRLEIYNLTDPAHPILLANDNTLGYIYNTGALAVQGDYIYCSSFDWVKKIGLLQIFKYSNDQKLIRKGSIQISNCEIRDIAIRYPYAYGVGDDNGTGMNKLQIFDVSDSAQPSLLGSLPFGPQYGSAGNLYVQGHFVYLAGGVSGLLAINVNNPNLPEEAASYHTTKTCDWVHGSGNRIYITDRSAGRVYILETLDSPSEVAISLSVKRKSDRAWAFHPNYADLEINVWNEDNLPVSRYLISRAEDQGTYIVVKEVSAAEMVSNKYNYRDFGLVNKKKYTYKVEALDAQGKVIATSEEVTI